METLTPEECWRLLSTATMGRLAVVDEEGADIFPINFLTGDHRLYFRSAPGLKIIDLTERSGVAFEADGTEARQRWSVVLRGAARRLNADAEIEEAGIHLLHTATPAAKHNYFVIEPRVITGRRFAAVRAAPGSRRRDVTYGA